MGSGGGGGGGRYAPISINSAPKKKLCYHSRAANLLLQFASKYERLINIVGGYSLETHV